MNFVDEFISRGYYYQCSALDELKDLTQKQRIGAYIGFDCTANSLHVGSLLQIMILRLLQQCGHKPIIIVGGGTTKIGDPTGRDEMRKVLTDSDIAANMAGIKKSLAKFIKFGDGENDAIMLNNADWLDSLGYIEFIRDYGKFFSVNRMLTMDSVKSRLERDQHLSFLEFNYMLLQSYDFYHLNKFHDCHVQIGGSDQWGNIIMGADFIRKISQKQAFALTTPLLTTASGTKMGKTSGNAVWLNEDLLAPYEYYQYWRNCEDADVIKFAQLYAEFNKDEMQAFEELAATEINEAKKRLAFVLTELCHGEREAQAAAEKAKKIFEENDPSALPIYEINRNELDSGISLVKIISSATFGELSNTQIRNLIKGEAIKIDDDKIIDEHFILQIDAPKELKLSIGKKRHIILRIV